MKTPLSPSWYVNRKPKSLATFLHYMLIPAPNFDGVVGRGWKREDMLLTHPFAILLQLLYAAMTSSCLPLQILHHIWQHVVVKGLSLAPCWKGTCLTIQWYPADSIQLQAMSQQILTPLTLGIFFLVTTLQLKELVVGKPPFGSEYSECWSW